LGRSPKTVERDFLSHITAGEMEVLDRVAIKVLRAAHDS